MKIFRTLAITGTILHSMILYAQNTCEAAISLESGFYSTSEIDGVNYGQGCWSASSANANSAEWYYFTPLADGVALVDTNFNENDGVSYTDSPRLSIYIGNCGNLNCLARDGAPPAVTPYRTTTRFEVRAGYTYYIAFDNYWSSKKVYFEFSYSQAICDTQLPYVENFKTHLEYTCWKPYESTNSTAWDWQFNEFMYLDGSGNPLPVATMRYRTDGLDKSGWLVSPAFSLEAGTTYRIGVKYNALNNGEITSESFRTVVLDQRNPFSAGLQQEIGHVEGITQQGNWGSVAEPPFNFDMAATAEYFFECETTGEYFFGIQATTHNSEQGILLLYEFSADITLDTELPKDTSFKVFPNPAEDVISITSKFPIDAVAVYDLQGRAIDCTVSASEGIIRLGTSRLPTGLYCLRIKSNDNVNAVKFQKL